MKILILASVLLLASCSEPTFKSEATADLEHLRPRELNDSQWESILYQHFLAVRGNDDFNFYGRVVDEDNLPVDGAIVKAEVSSNNDDLAVSLRRKTFRAPEKEFTITTSSDGTFGILDQRGFSLTLLSIRKHGMSLEGQTWFSYSVTSNSEGGDNLGSPNDPILFRMSKLQN